MTPAGQPWLRPAATTSIMPRWRVVTSFVAASLAVALLHEPDSLPTYYFFRQDILVLCAMVIGAALFPRVMSKRRWESELRFSPQLGIAAASLLLLIGIAGHWLVMSGFDLSRDEAMAEFASRQLAAGEIVTSVPEEWRPFGRAMLPTFFNGRLSPEVAWTSGYLPVNSILRAVGAKLASSAIVNPVLLVAGLLALWDVAQRLWPQRPDAALIAVILAGTSSQLIVNSMTSYAMVGHFALNMVWLALFLRKKWTCDLGAIVVGFAAMGLHQIHFHPLFVAPFLLWLVGRGQLSRVAFFGLAYAVITLFWFRVYPAWLITHADPLAIVEQPDRTLFQYLLGRLRRFADYSPVVVFANLARFIAWQNVLLIPLALFALPMLRNRSDRKDGLLVPLSAVCGLGLLLMVYQGHGWGYRYLSGAIGAFCLVAAYGWVRIVPQRGTGRHWSVLKVACAFSLLLVLPTQLMMARDFVSPYAELFRAAKAAPVDVVLVDVSGGFFAQDIVQNGPDFAVSPKIMDLTYVAEHDLTTLCQTKTVAIIDRRHYRKVGMLEQPMPDALETSLTDKRAFLDREGCATPVDLGLAAG
jgi:hypothetical protein